GLDDLIAAMPLLATRHGEAKLILVGGGPCEADLRAQASSSAADSSICFTGRVPHDEVERYYALADILVYPRKRSRLTDLVTPLKPLEAMAQGKVVAASNVGGHRELIDDGKTGKLFAADDPRACASTLTDLLDHQEHWPAYSEMGRNHVRSEHDWAANVLRYQDVYQTLLTKEDQGIQVAAV
ncbi:MAG: glycosyltransferase, partial [Novosphingobium sp.]|nr:glycosyltransferase [Novosphingobium sp.]